MLQIQFVDRDQNRGVYVCQFCESEDPRVTYRLTHPMLSGLKVLALDLEWDHRQSPGRSERLDRIDELFNRVAMAVRDEPEQLTESPLALGCTRGHKEDECTCWWSV